jgi:hypothetical protein
MDEWDVFISHASEDKAEVALPLAVELRRRGMRVWLDAQKLSLGDKLREKISEALRLSRFGVVVLSPNSASKQWPRDEISALMARERNDIKRVLPVLHHLDADEVADAFPLLADRLSVSTAAGIGSIADAIEIIVLNPQSQSPTSVAPSVARQFIALLEQNTDRAAIRAFLRRHREIVVRASGMSEPQIVWEPQLGSQIADYAVGEIWRSVSRVVWRVMLLGPQAPFACDREPMIEQIDPWVAEAESLRTWVRSHLREARMTLDEIEGDFDIVIAMGRRPEPETAVAQWLRAYNDEQFDLRVRTYDWLIDAALTLEEGSK